MNKLLLAFFDNKIATDFAQFGGKAASLAIMYQNMQKIGIDVPYGFTTTAQAYRDFIESNNLTPIIKENIERYHNNPSLENLEQCSKNIRASMEAGTLPPQLEEQFLAALHELHDTTCMQCNPADTTRILRYTLKGTQDERVVAPKDNMQIRTSNPGLELPNKEIDPQSPFALVCWKY